MKRKNKLILTMLLAVITISLLGCATAAAPEKTADLTILSGSENQVLEPIISEFNKNNNVTVKLTYQGSVDIMRELQKTTPGYDAVFPANSLWVDMGDKLHKVKHLESISTTPVVFGIKKSVAEGLGFVGKPVTIKNILTAIENKKMNFMMTSATQSNSGASAYIGFIYSLLGNPEMITKADLTNPKLTKNLKTLLSGVNRSSGSSNWLCDLFLKGSYNAMVNYESLIIDTNKKLIAQGKEPLYIVYPTDGLTIADSPLGYIDKGDATKEVLFTKFQSYLLSSKVQAKILALGRRTGVGGTLTNVDPKIFNPAWGIDTKKILSPIKMPSTDVITDALNLYQTRLKKPSHTIFCVDFSGSMAGNGGEEQAKAAMKTLLTQSIAKQYLLQASPSDTITVIPFSDHIISKWTIKGNNSTELNNLYKKIDSLEANNGTDIYSPVIDALKDMKNDDLSKISPSIILMTDGESNTGANFSDLQAAVKTTKLDIPIFSISFGDASSDQLNDIANLTRAKVFDGSANLVNSFREVKGYN